MSAQVAVLFARCDSIYKTLPGVDVWDADRDARNFAGGMPVIAHPPCRGWGRLHHFARCTSDELALAPWAVDQVRKWGGVLEHPLGSALWKARLPLPGYGPDEFGGWTLAVPQLWWGHRAEKMTWLYIVGVMPGFAPDIPLALGSAPCVIANSRKRQKGRFRPEVTKREREATPEPFARWLIDLALRCGTRNEVTA